MTTTAKERELVMNRLMSLGLTWDDAAALRRISMTLHRWFELECGDGNDYASWCIVRGHAPKREFYRDPATQAPQWRTVGEFTYADDGAPYMEKHIHTENKPRYTRLADKETGARKRLAKIMERYPKLTYYVQTDPRGSSLYILTKEDVGDYELEQIYNRGVAVY